MRLLAWPALLVAVFATVARPDEPPAKKKVPVTGKADEKFARFDELMTTFLDKYDHPGAAVAVGKAGKVLYARGFGYADRDAKKVLEPDALFRISSVSKPFTAVAVLQLVERGKLRLDSKVMDVLGLTPPPRGFDARWRKITIRHLLEHRGGWDANKSKKDPMFLSPLVVHEMGGTHPAAPWTIIRWMLRQPLEFDPGEKFVYSNFGYCLLGRVIERLGKQGYEAHVKKNVLAPLGIKNMRLGRSLLSSRAPGEVKYHSSIKGTGQLGPQFGRPVPQAYGGFCLESMDAHAGWIASAADLVRFAMAFDDPENCKLLKASSIETMLARPEGTDEKKPIYYAMGWSVRPIGKGLPAYWHDGALDGSGAMLVRRPDGVVLALLLNSREKADGHEPIAVLDTPLHLAANYVFKPK